MVIYRINDLDMIPRNSRTVSLFGRWLDNIFTRGLEEEEKISFIMQQTMVKRLLKVSVNNIH